MDINDVNWSCELDGELFEFESSGSTIRGCHWKCSKDPKYVLLFLHGLCSNVEFNANFLRVFPTISEKYPQLNYESGAALATDHHGNGFSDGTTTTVNEIITEACDLIKYTRSIYKDLPIFLMGHSLGGLSSLILSINKREILIELSGIIVHAPWLATEESRGPNLFQTAGIKVLQYLYPTYSFNSGLNVEASKYPEGYKSVARVNKHLNPFMSVRLFGSVLSSIDFIKQHQDDIPKDIKILFMQGLDDNCVDLKFNLEWADSLVKARSGMVTLKTYDNAPHDLFKWDSRREAFIDLLTFIHNICNSK